MNKKNYFNILLLRRNVGLYGADHVILLLAQFLIRSGHRPVVGVINDQRNPDKMLFEKAQELNIETVQFVSNSRLDIKTIKKIFEYVKNNKIDIIHTHGFKADIYGFFASKRLHVPIVATKHGWTHGNYMIRIWEKVDIYFLRYFNRIIAVSDAIESTLVQKKIKQQSLTKVYNGIQTDLPDLDTTPLETSLRLQNHPVVGIVGRLSIEKGHDTFIQAAKKVIHQKSETRFLIIGDGPLEKDLKQRVAMQNLKESIIFVGFQKNIFPFYKIMDILVSTSLREGVPMNILEAMAAKKAIIATKVGGVPTMIQHEENGILIDVGDVDNLTSHILNLLNHPELSQKLGENAFQTVQNKYSAEQMAEQYIKQYQIVIQEKEKSQ